MKPKRVSSTSASSRLPLEVLQLICKYALPLTSASSLLVVDSRWFRAAAACLYENLVILDDDSLLLLAAEPESALFGRFDNLSNKLYVSTLRKLQALYSVKHDVYAKSVRCLEIVPGKASWRTLEDTLQENGRDGTSTPEVAFVQPDPLDEIVLHNLLKTRLTNLERLVWKAARPPPDIVIDAFNASSNLSKLRSFTGWMADAVPSSEQSTPPATPVIGSSETSLTRWNGHAISYLPVTITNLCLQNLSAEGVKVLISAAPSLRNLEHLALEHTLFVDDALLTALGESCVKLVSLAIRSMQGTKLTNTGIHSLMENAASLQSLELRDVEGEFSAQYVICS